MTLLTSFWTNERMLLKTVSFYSVMELLNQLLYLDVIDMVEISRRKKTNRFSFYEISGEINLNKINWIFI